MKLETILNITSGIYAKYHVQIMLLFVYATTRRRFVIFTLALIIMLIVAFIFF